MCLDINSKAFNSFSCVIFLFRVTESLSLLKGSALISESYLWPMNHVKFHLSFLMEMGIKATS